jgi:hypothetical protein
VEDSADLVFDQEVLLGFCSRKFFSRNSHFLWRVLGIHDRIKQNGLRLRWVHGPRRRSFS